jgi:hypothetical protein
MDPKRSWEDYWEWADYWDDLYDNYFQSAYVSGLDWDNNPPPLETVDEDMCFGDVHNKPLNLGKMPVEFRTEKVCYEAVYNDDDALQFVPENMREKIKTWKDAITEAEWLDNLGWYDCWHWSIKLPKKIITPEFCRAMVKANGCTYCLLPEELKTPELLAIAKNNTFECCSYDNPPPVNK